MARPRSLSRQTRVTLVAMRAAPDVWRHGYELMEQTGLASGTLYPMLMRLCDQGLLEAKWLPSPLPGRPARHAYRLTHTGLALAQTADQTAPDAHNLGGGFPA